MLDQATLDKLKTVFAELNSTYTIIIEAHDHPARMKMVEMMRDVASTSDQIHFEEHPVHDLRFRIEKDGQQLPIEFKGIPGGNEFTTLILAILNADGKG